MLDVAFGQANLLHLSNTDARCRGKTKFYKNFRGDTKPLGGIVIPSVLELLSTHKVLRARIPSLATVIGMFRVRKVTMGVHIARKRETGLFGLNCFLLEAIPDLVCRTGLLPSLLVSEILRCLLGGRLPLAVILAILH